MRHVLSINMAKSCLLSQKEAIWLTWQVTKLRRFPHTLSTNMQDYPQTKPTFIDRIFWAFFSETVSCSENFTVSQKFMLPLATSTRKCVFMEVRRASVIAAVNIQKVVARKVHQGPQVLWASEAETTSYLSVRKAVCKCTTLLFTHAEIKPPYWNWTTLMK